MTDGVPRPQRGSCGGWGIKSWVLLLRAPPRRGKAPRVDRPDCTRPRSSGSAGKSQLGFHWAREHFADEHTAWVEQRGRLSARLTSLHTLTGTYTGPLPVLALMAGFWNAGTKAVIGLFVGGLFIWLRPVAARINGTFNLFDIFICIVDPLTSLTATLGLFGIAYSDCRWLEWVIQRIPIGELTQMVNYSSVDPKLDAQTFHLLLKDVGGPHAKPMRLRKRKSPSEDPNDIVYRGEYEDVPLSKSSCSWIIHAYHREPRWRTPSQWSLRSSLESAGYCWGIYAIGAFLGIVAFVARVVFIIVLWATAKEGQIALRLVELLDSFLVLVSVEARWGESAVMTARYLCFADSSVDYKTRDNGELKTKQFNIKTTDHADYLAVLAGRSAAFRTRGIGTVVEAVVKWFHTDGWRKLAGPTHRMGDNTNFRTLVVGDEGDDAEEWPVYDVFVGDNNVPSASFKMPLAIERLLGTSNNTTPQARSILKWVSGFFIISSGFYSYFLPYFLAETSHPRETRFWFAMPCACAACSLFLDRTGWGRLNRPPAWMTYERASQA